MEHKKCQSRQLCSVVRSKFLALGGAFVVALGLLIWLKLRVVSDVPKTAYADPAPPTATAPAR